MFGIFNKNSIARIARKLPPALVTAFDQQNYYSAEEVKSVFEQELKTDHNVDYAFAMFCSEQDYKALHLEFTYKDLRLNVSKKCFGSWPRFNFQSLLDYSHRSSIGGGGVGDGGDGGCGGGGE